MRKVELLKDRDFLYELLRRDIEQQLFLVGDLDDLYWEQTTWYCLTEAGEPRALALRYESVPIPTVLLFDSGRFDQGLALLSAIEDQLPLEYFAHLSPRLFGFFRPEQVVANYGLSIKMVARKTFDPEPDEHIRFLDSQDIGTIKELLTVAYPQNWFDERMVLTGKYVGYFDQERLVALAGIHIFSAAYKVAALGNIAVHPDFRGKGLATRVTRYLCHDLQHQVEVIGLNVRAENRAAISCYQKLGFEIVGDYVECRIKG